jgi:hypothetical protein
MNITLFLVLRIHICLKSDYNKNLYHNLYSMNTSFMLINYYRLANKYYSCSSYYDIRRNSCISTQVGSLILYSKDLTSICLLTHDTSHYLGISSGGLALSWRDLVYNSILIIRIVDLLNIYRLDSLIHSYKVEVLVIELNKTEMK